MGVIIGAAGDLIMPLIGAIIGGLDFSNYHVTLSSAIQGHPAYADPRKSARCSAMVRS